MGSSYTEKDQNIEMQTDPAEYVLSSKVEYVTNDQSGLRTWGKLLEEIRQADRVRVDWDGHSKEGLFQLGMAFALRKPIVIDSLPTYDDHTKSFPRMITAWVEQPDFESSSTPDPQKMIFLICPVRNQDEATRLLLEEISQDPNIYYPARETNQLDETGGLRICADNRCAMESAQEVWFVWDGLSQGSIFDLGMAFALAKPIKPISVPVPSQEPSFQNFATEYTIYGRLV
ncbi:hypothetical protein KBC89_04525 [Candidatus Woesebacteria bacterium]|nr:hypothetical protein [Candidatus Woesebacteria bacterium]